MPSGLTAHEKQFRDGNLSTALVLAEGTAVEDGSRGLRPEVQR